MDQHAAVLRGFSVVELWRLRRVCRAFRRWGTAALAALPPIVAVGGMVSEDGGELGDGTVTVPDSEETALVEVLDLSTATTRGSAASAAVPHRWNARHTRRSRQSSTTEKPRSTAACWSIWPSAMSVSSAARLHWKAIAAISPPTPPHSDPRNSFIMIVDEYSRLYLNITSTVSIPPRLWRRRQQ